MKEKIISLFEDEEEFEEYMRYFKPMMFGLVMTIVAILI